MRERILGYDVREMWYADQWELVRQGRFKKMVSISGSIWGSIFDHGGYPDLVGAEREKYGLGTLQLPEMLVVGMNLPFWSNVAELLDYVKTEAPKSERLYWLVAITICLEDPEAELKDRVEWPYYAETTPDTVQEDWVLMGYDVTTCYTESVIGVELDVCRERGQVCEIEKDVNPYLLFENITRANQYRSALDTTDEHRTPHMVYGIWRVGELVI